MTNHENQPEETRPEHINVYDKVVKYLEQSETLHMDVTSFVDIDLTHQTAKILYGNSNDKLGEIRDLFNKAISETASYVEKNYATCGVSEQLYFQSIRDDI
jgi:hypothetical protein